MLKTKRLFIHDNGQGTLEYLIVIAAIIAIIIVGSMTFMKPAVNEVMDRIGNIVKNAANEF